MELREYLVRTIFLLNLVVNAYNHYTPRCQRTIIAI
jgi:hypothetical protein